MHLKGLQQNHYGLSFILNLVNPYTQNKPLCHQAMVVCFFNEAWPLCDNQAPGAACLAHSAVCGPVM